MHYHHHHHHHHDHHSVFQVLVSISIILAKQKQIKRITMSQSTEEKEEVYVWDPSPGSLSCLYVCIIQAMYLTFSHAPVVIGLRVMYILLAP